MDERQRRKVATMLEFYEDLGIEEFYIGRAGIAKVASDRGRAISGDGARRSASAEVKHGPRPQTSNVGFEKPPAAQSKQAAALQTTAAPGPMAQSMSLFETSSQAMAPREDETLEQIREDLGDCHRCRLASGRHTIVFGQGNPHADLVFVGEGPGADEDAQGLPFVGRAGRLLNRMIELAGMKREDVYICNIVKCRPPNNRTPLPDEIETCSPFLLRQIRTIKPRLVCCLGAPAVKTLLGVKEGITKIRGQFYDFQGTKALPTFHPAYVLRNPREEKILREDFQKIVEFLASLH
ncbi:MAG: uracil-DNA glycosylase [Acidobacteria bacterium]|nr:MAG: uracil-DNA glycosylase [Acidobacteriota bacterium]